MAFLDNSGDIILDAVLTDTGRLRLAQGDGSFKISKFALGDDEINYSLYNKDHASGSAYYDLEVLQTPILEAFTNNTSNLKTKLVTMSRTNVLYMPILKLNENIISNNPIQHHPSKTYDRKGSSVNTDTGGADDGAVDKTAALFYVAVDKDTYKAFTEHEKVGTNDIVTEDISTNALVRGVMQGFNANGTDLPLGGGIIRVDHGMDTNEVAPNIGMDSDLQESAFIVEVDYRLGRLKPSNSDTTKPVNFIDDDNIATYYVTEGNYINPKNGTSPATTNTVDENTIEQLASTNPQVFNGPRGNTLQFRIEASQDLKQSTYLFTQIGTTADADAAGNIFGFPTSGDSRITDKNVYYIDSIVRVVGANTGYRLDIPVRFVKLAT
tara:strand:- start:640 stop:1782 length:1143 start_codon:yes stop_codon:yes gene_type:complete